MYDAHRRPLRRPDAERIHTAVNRGITPLFTAVTTNACELQRCFPFAQRKENTNA